MRTLFLETNPICVKQALADGQCYNELRMPWQMTGPAAEKLKPLKNCIASEPCQRKQHSPSVTRRKHKPRASLSLKNGRRAFLDFLIFFLLT